MRKYVEINRRSYDALADEYETRIDETIDKMITDPIVEISKTRFRPPIKVLEVGPGVGSILSMFEKHGFRTLGIEISGAMASHAQTRSRNSFVIQADFLLVRLVPESFNIVYAGAFIHLFPKKTSMRILRRFNELMTNRGLMFINTTIHHVSKEGFFEKTDFDRTLTRFRKHWSEEELKTALHDADFHILRRLYKEVGHKRWVGFICDKKV